MPQTPAPAPEHVDHEAVERFSGEGVCGRRFVELSVEECASVLANAWHT